MKDLRDFIARCEEENVLHRIKSEVDWNLELAHTAKLNEEKGGSCLLFENVKDYNIPVLTSAFATVKRLAITLGLPTYYSLGDLSREWMKLSKNSVKPKVVDDGPVLENVVQGDKINVLDFPSPMFYPDDGGRYIGTSAYLVTEDPETGWTNLGTYRMQVFDEKRIGVQLLKGKHADLMLKQYKEMGKKMPAAIVIGGDPLISLVASSTMPIQTDEYNVAGAIRGGAVEVIKSDFTGLTLPAHAEIIIEGEIDPDDLIEEGPFAEYTGYYSGSKGKDSPKVYLNAQRVMYRNNPIFWATAVGKPINDVNMIQSLTRIGTLWADLEAMKIPGIKSVYIPPASLGRFWAIVSVEQKYPGHSMQVGTAVISTTTGSYGLKGVIVVDADIAADDWDRVMWALSVRYDPRRSTQIINRGRSTSLDPALPINARDITSRIIMDACTPYEWKEKPELVVPDKETVKKVQSRWKEFGLGEWK